MTDAPENIETPSDASEAEIADAVIEDAEIIDAEIAEEESVEPEIIAAEAVDGDGHSVAAPPIAGTKAQLSGSRYSSNCQLLTSFLYI